MVDVILSNKKIIHRDETTFKLYFISMLNNDDIDVICYNHVDKYKILDNHLYNIKTNEVYTFDDYTRYINIEFNNINIDMISDVYSDFGKIFIIRCDTTYKMDDKILLKNRIKRNYKVYIRLYFNSFLPETFNIYYKAYIFNNRTLKDLNCV